MNILLISPCLSTSERYGSALGKVGPTTEPLGLAYLAAYLREKRPGRDHIEIIDMAALNYGEKELTMKLREREWSLTGIMILTPMYLRAKETAAIIRRESRNSKIIFGGPHVTIFPNKTLEETPDVDIGVIGEGEVTFHELVDSLENKKSLKNIKGIAYKTSHKVQLTKPRDLTANIDSLPRPARDLLPMKLYRPAPTYYKKLPSYIMLTSRGCPFSCAYCSKIFGKQYRFHSVERIISEMEELVYKYKAKEIIFRDDTFTINKDHVTKLCQEIIKRGLHKKTKWTCMTRVSLVNPELLSLMKKAGCWSIHYGVESGSQRLINLIEKGITLEQVRNAFKWTRKAGIETKAFFMLGLPTETREESLQTLKFTRELDPDWIQVTITVPYPGTKLFEIAKKNNTLKSYKWEDYQTWAGWSNKNLVYYPEGRNPDELKALQTRAMREFYLRPKFIVRQLLNLKSFENVKSYSQGAMALIQSRLK